MLPKAYRNLRQFVISRENVGQIIDNIGGLEKLVDYINDPLVTAEILQFREARERNPYGLARNVILFAMLSPQTRFEANVTAFHNLLAIWDRNPSLEEIREAIVGVQFSATKAQRILDARKFLDDENLPTRMNRHNLLKLKGMGHKTTSFALALFDDLSPVFTLDLHMLRAISWATGFGHDVNVILRKNVHTTLEDAVVNYLREKSVASPFVAQWSLWNAWGFNRHVSHLPILEGV